MHANRDSPPRHNCLTPTVRPLDILGFKLGHIEEIAKCVEAVAPRELGQRSGQVADIGGGLRTVPVRRGDGKRRLICHRDSPAPSRIT